MKKLVLFFAVIFLLTACQEPEIFQEFQSLEILDLRVESHDHLKFFDHETGRFSVLNGETGKQLPDAIMGYTVVVYSGNNLIFKDRWQLGYKTVYPKKSKIIFSPGKDAIVSFIGNEIFFKEMAIILNGKVVKKMDFSTVSIKKIEINEITGEVRITSNGSWVEDPGLPDKVTVISY